jgi:hypothetical protein
LKRGGKTHEAETDSFDRYVTAVRLLGLCPVWGRRWSRSWRWNRNRWRGQCGDAGCTERNHGLALRKHGNSDRNDGRSDPRTWHSDYDSRSDYTDAGGNDNWPRSYDQQSQRIADHTGDNRARHVSRGKPEYAEHNSRRNSQFTDCGAEHAVDNS